jgi:hypothetical protein
VQTESFWREIIGDMREATLAIMTAELGHLQSSLHYFRGSERTSTISENMFGNKLRANP